MKYEKEGDRMDKCPPFVFQSNLVHSGIFYSRNIIYTLWTGNAYPTPSKANSINNVIVHGSFDSSVQSAIREPF